MDQKDRSFRIPTIFRISNNNNEDGQTDRQKSKASMGDNSTEQKGLSFKNAFANLTKVRNTSGPEDGEMGGSVLGDASSDSNKVDKASLLKIPFSSMRKLGDTGDSASTEFSSQQQVPEVKTESTLPRMYSSASASFFSTVSMSTQGKKSDKASRMVNAAPITNAFKGIGAALNSTMKTNVTSGSKPSNRTFGIAVIDDKNKPTLPNMMKNPFGRFGTGTKPQQQGKSAVLGLGRMNQFRKTTMARMRNAGGGEDDDAAEEAIDFDLSTPKTVDSEDLSGHIEQA